MQFDPGAGRSGGRDMLRRRGRDEHIRLAGPLADLGMTWWVERMPWGDDLGRAGPVLRRIEQGPPRI